MEVDIGTGSGIWCTEVAQQFPSTKVVGTDLSPIQPTDVPDNCQFRIESLLDGLSFDAGSVDYLQERYSRLFSKFDTDERSLIGGIPESAWPDFIAEIYRVLKPGIGRAVFLEPDVVFKSENNSITEETYMRKVPHLLTSIIHNKELTDDSGNGYYLVSLG
jgi:SAM-dependent methyltransferase